MLDIANTTKQKESKNWFKSSYNYRKLTQHAKIKCILASHRKSFDNVNVHKTRRPDYVKLHLK